MAEQAAEDCVPLLPADGGATIANTNAGSLEAAEAGLAGSQRCGTAGTAGSAATTEQQPLPPACRICLQDDDPSGLERPCSCSGSMAVSAACPLCGCPQLEECRASRLPQSRTRKTS